jgi:DNA mismatch repair protein MutL
MTAIQPLSPEIVSHIKAGEVIERPCYVVKELVENSLDAGATRISIHLEEGGIRLIRVQDNGTGMTQENLLQAVLPHTTSKIQTLDDIYHVSTFGFRGEALHSIAAVSKLSIQSRPADADAGLLLSVDGNIHSSVQKVGMPTGTIVTAEQLFSTTPARKKFLSSRQTELRTTVELVSALALAHPEVAIRLVHNNKMLLDLPGKQSLEERSVELMGTVAAQAFIPLKIDDPHLQVTGYIAKPLPQGNTSRQFLYVNKRTVSYPKLSLAIKQQYGSLLEPRVQPVFVLHLQVPVQLVDVNVHPRKEEVRFEHEHAVLARVSQAVAEVLRQHNLVYTLPPTEVDIIKDGNTNTYAASVLKQEYQRNHPIPESSRSVLQAHNLYLIAETATGVLFVDQHAAHERILYEQFLQMYQSRQFDTVALEQSVLWELPLADAMVVQEELATFQQIGFEIEPFGERSFKINAVPVLLQDRDIIGVLVDTIRDLREGIGLARVDSRTNRMLSYLACRSAIKAGEPLSQERAQKLIQQLQQCTVPYTCPHGRPTEVEITTKEFHKLFHRIK